MITLEQFTALEFFYNYYNETIFNSTLKPCLLNLSRTSNKRCLGFFSPETWQENIKNTVFHEISLTPNSLNRSPIEWHSTLVHEMVHLWQKDFANPGRGGYHNKEWGTKMEEIGLMPSNTGLPGGKRTGDQMTHYLIPNGKFEVAFKNLKETNIPCLIYNEPINEGDPYGTNPDGIVIIEKAKTIKKNGVKFKYQCPCGNNVWGKPELKLLCYDCKGVFFQL